MLVCFFDTGRIIWKEFIQPGQTINVNFYCDIMRQLTEDVAEAATDKWRTNNWLLHLDNAPTHTALALQQFLCPKTWRSCAPPPPFSPHLARDFFLFSDIKIKLKEWRFNTVGSTFRLNCRRCQRRFTKGFPGQFPIIVYAPKGTVALRTLCLFDTFQALFVNTYKASDLADSCTQI